MSLLSVLYTEFKKIIAQIPTNTQNTYRTSRLHTRLNESLANDKNNNRKIMSHTLDGNERIDDGYIDIIKDINNDNTRKNK